jgi:putative Holliday junction resolvase
VRLGVRIGVDVGSVRVGVAASDASAILASPVETLARDAEGDSDLAAIAALARDRSAVEVVVGLPRSLSGQDGAAARIARDYATRLAALVEPVPVRLVDERLTTVTAHQVLRGAGVSGRKSRGVVDQVAAVVILQNALDGERATGRPAGEPVAPG